MVHSRSVEALPSARKRARCFKLGRLMYRAQPVEKAFLLLSRAVQEA